MLPRKDIDFTFQAQSPPCTDHRHGRILQANSQFINKCNSLKQYAALG